MSTKIHFTSLTLLDLKFDKNVKGYDAYQVDVTLDRVLSDYRYYENFYREAKDYIAELEGEVKGLKTKNQKLTLENSKLENRLKGISSNKNAGSDNISLLRRIDALERALFAHGVDPTKIK